MDFNTITLKIKNGIGHITLRRPDNANALNATMAHELLEATIACDVDSSVRVVLLDAEGKMFCAGGDLGGLGFGQFAVRLAQQDTELGDADGAGEASPGV